METIIVKPKTKKELNFLKEFFEKTNTHIEYKEEVNETDVYYPKLDKKIKKALKEREQGVSPIVLRVF